jgi:hypothetical protein
MKKESWQSDTDAQASQPLEYLFWIFVLVCLLLAAPFIGWVIKSMLYWLGFR